MTWATVLKIKYADWGEAGLYPWTDAFSKWGFGDNLESGDYTDDVHLYLEELGYKVVRTDTSIHNVYISQITKGEGIYYGTSETVLYEHSKEGYGKPSVEEQLKETDPELLAKLNEEFKDGIEVMEYGSL